MGTRFQYIGLCYVLRLTWATEINWSGFHTVSLHLNNYEYAMYCLEEFCISLKVHAAEVLKPTTDTVLTSSVDFNHFLACCYLTSVKWSIHHCLFSLNVTVVERSWPKVLIFLLAEAYLLYRGALNCCRLLANWRCPAVDGSSLFSARTMVL